MKFEDLYKWLDPDLRPPNYDAYVTEESEMPAKLKELRGKFADDTRAKGALEAFKALYARQVDRSRHAETRAATIQGAVSIAASLIFAAASLTIDRSKVHDSLLRWVLAGLAVATILAFVAAALRSMQAHMTLHRWKRPDIYDVSGGSVNSLTTRQEVGEYWYVISENERIVRWKLDRLKEAKWHFRNAILMLGLLAIAALVTVVADTSPEVQPTQVEIVHER